MTARIESVLVALTAIAALFVACPTIAVAQSCTPAGQGPCLQGRALAAPAPVAPTTNATPRFAHIVVVMEENHSLAEIIGNAQAPYINSLANAGALLSNYHAVAHPSQPNYFAIYAGSTFGVTDDGTYSEPDPTLATVLQGAGQNFIGYVESGSPRKHDPWESFPEGMTVERDFTTFPTDFTELPKVAFVIPNLNHDMHDGTIAQGDQWLKTNIDAYAQWAVKHNSLLMIVWDEDDGSQSNQVPAIVYGAHVVSGLYGDAYTHYDVLRTLLNASGLGPKAPNNAAQASGLGNRIFSVSSVTHDFNGDNFSDIAWRDGAGDFALWLMNGAAVTTSGGANVHASWSIVGQRDFDGDGKADLLWRDTNSGATSMWFMNGTQVASSGAVGIIAPSWSVVGTGDFDGDGLGDILWQDTNGNLSVWLMKGASVTSSVGLGSVPAIWSVAGTGDFDGDGKSDILWRDTSGNTSIWFMNGTQVTSSGGVGNIPAIWSVVGTGDFNGDGMADIVWRDNLGNISIWLMKGAAVLMAGGLGNVSTNWSIVQVGDYNGDGMSDLLWRDTTSGPTSGNTSIWFMNGTAVASTAPVGNIPTTWAVQSVNAE